LHEIEEFNLNQNHLIDLKNFKYFSGLIVLSLSSNKIKPQTLLELPPSLKKLEIKNNQIRSLTILNGTYSILQSLINLEELDISFNNIEKINERTFSSNLNLRVKKGFFSLFYLIFLNRN